MQNLGLIGGLGPAATVHYYRELVAANAGELLIVHADLSRLMAYVQADERILLAEYLAGLIDRLAGAGADVAAISAVTPHVCMDELMPRSTLPIVDAVDAVAADIQLRGYRRIALFGTRFVVESRMFGKLENVEVLGTDRADEIHEAYMHAVRGNIESSVEVLARIAWALPIDAVVIAGTDLSPVFDDNAAGVPCIDAAAVHVRAIMSALGS